MEAEKIIKLFGLSFSFSTTISIIVVTVLLVGVFWYINHHLSVDKPNKLQLALEWLVDFIQEIVYQNFHTKDTGVYQLFAFVLFVFILLSNLIGLPFLLHFDGVSYWRSPTADILVCATLAVMMNIISQLLAIQKKGLGGFLKSFWFKKWYTFPVTLIEEIINLTTLSLRLYGNIFAGEVLLGLIAQFGNLLGIWTWIPAIPLQIVWQAFSIFIGCIQAYIFVTLSMLYLSEKVQAGEEE